MVNSEWAGGKPGGYRINTHCIEKIQASDIGSIHSLFTIHHSRLFDAPEAVVMIVSIVKLAAAAGHDTPRSPALHPRRSDRVLAVITSRLRRQPPLEVAENNAV